MDSNKFCKSLYEILGRRENVTVKLGAKIRKYAMSDQGRVTQIELESGEVIPCDLVVLCTGAQTPFHLWEHFKVVLPNVSGQGYVFDFELDQAVAEPVSLYMANTPNTYCQSEPKMVRMASLVDLGVLREPAIDPKRRAFVHRILQRDYELTAEQVESRVHDFRAGLRPMSPDMRFVVGPLRAYPNVLVNTGYGPYGYMSVCGAKILESIVYGDPQSAAIFHEEVLKEISPARFGI